jgi:hypothetical protein
VRLTGLTVVAAAAAICGLVFAAPASASVLVVGDSLSLGTAPYLKQRLGSIPLEVDAVTGRPSSRGVAVLAERLRPEDEVVVFDLGVNDGPSRPDVLSASLAAARNLAGGRCIVVGTVMRPPVRGVSVEAQNRVVRGFVASTPGAQLVDWRSAARSQPGLVASDGVHGTSAGYSLRGSLFAEAVVNCLAGNGDSGLPAPRRNRAKRPRRPHRHVRPPLRPARINWRALAAGRPLSDALLWADGIAQRIVAAGAALRVALTGPTPEPVLGAPEG